MDQAASLLRAAVARGRCPGLQYIAVDRSRTLFELHAGLADVATGRPVVSGSTMMAYSMSKTLTAAAVLQLAGESRLGLDDPVARHLPWQPYGGRITVRQLLAHTSGVPNPLPLRWVHAASAHAGFDEGAALRDVLARHPRLAFEPGSRFGYSNVGYWLLGAIVECVTGRPFAAHVAERLLHPLGATGELGYSVTDPRTHAHGYLERYSMFGVLTPWLIDRDLIGGTAGRWVEIRPHHVNGPAFGGLVGTAGGFARFLRDQLAPHSVLFDDGTRAQFVEPQRTRDGRTVPMTLGWHVRGNGGLRQLYKEGGGGGFHCMMRLYPDHGLGSVLMTNATGNDVSSLLDEVDGAILAARPAAR